MCKIFVVLILCATISACSTKYTKPHVRIETSVGDIELELYPDKAPKTVAAFLDNVKKGNYKGGSFYRVLKNENVPEEYNSGLIQGGIYLSNPTLQKTVPHIPHESPKQTGLTHESGTISMARTTPGSATTEFFICIGDQNHFDSSSISGNNDGLGYAAFGKVVSGMKVARKIQNKKSNGESFEVPEKIKNIKEL